MRVGSVYTSCLVGGSALSSVAFFFQFFFCCCYATSTPLSPFFSLLFVHTLFRWFCLAGLELKSPVGLSCLACCPFPFILHKPEPRWTDSVRLRGHSTQDARDAWKTDFDKFVVVKKNLIKSKWWNDKTLATPTATERPTETVTSARNCPREDQVFSIHFLILVDSLARGANAQPSCLSGLCCAVLRLLTVVVLPASAVL